MKMILVAGIVVAMGLAACTTTYTIYRSDISEGKNLLKQGEYARARALFVKASEQKRAAPFAYAATASYKMNDLPAAEGYLKEAEKMEGRSYTYPRVAGYKALVFLKEGKQAEGLKALKTYIDYYKHLYPLTTIEEVEAMQKEGKVNQGLLESLIDEQVDTYESDVEQAITTGTGFYSTRVPPGVLIPRPMSD